MTERSYFYYDELDSTMQEHKRLQDCCDGLICVRTGTQDDGKGRGEKIWLSPPEGLWFTFDLKNTEVVPSFSLFIGYCLHRELSRSLPRFRVNSASNGQTTSCTKARNWAVSSAKITLAAISSELALIPIT